MEGEGDWEGEDETVAEGDIDACEPASAWRTQTRHFNGHAFRTSPRYKGKEND